MKHTELEKYLHKHIPISQAMGMMVVTADDTRVVIQAPLEPNINHRNSVFGGSIASVATLAGWGLVKLLLGDRDPVPTIVIKSCEIDYLRPALADFTATAVAPDLNAVNGFLHMLDRRGRSRIHLTCEVSSQDEVVAILKGVFVVTS